MRRNLRLAAGVAAVAAAAVAVPAINSLTAQATIDGAGHFVVYRVGDGSGPLSNAAAPVFLDEYSLAGTKIESLALPTTASGAQHALTATGLSRSEGGLVASPDGHYLTLTGYDAAPGDTAAGGLSLTATDPVTTARTVAVVDGNNTIDTSTVLSDASAPQIVRSAATVDGSQVWATGGNGGLSSIALGGTTPVRVAGTAASNLNQVSVQGGQLFTSNSAGARLTAVGSGTPTDAGNSLTAVPGLPESFLPFGYAFLDLDSANYAGTGLDTLYYVDAADRAGTIHKYRYNGSSWQDAGYTDLEEGFGLAAVADGSTVTLVATTPTSLVKLIDGAGTANTFAPTTAEIATADANTEFRGVAVAPEDPQGPSIIVRTPKLSTQVAATATSLNVKADVSGPDPISSVTVQLDSNTPVAATLGTGASYSAALSLTGATKGNHTVTVAATDSAGSTTSARTFTYKPVKVPAGNIGPSTASLVNNAKVTNTGFTNVNYPTSPNGKGLKTTALATSSFKAYGRSITLYFQKRPDAGKIQVTIDTKKTTIDLYSASTQNTSQTFSGLKLKSHNVVIKALKKKSAASSGTNVVLGYVNVGQW